MLEIVAAALIPVKAYCVVTTVTECGFVQEVKSSDGQVIEGIVTYESLASTMLNRTPYEHVFILPEAEYRKIWESAIWEKDIEFVFRWIDSEWPDWPVCKVQSYEFLSKLNFD